MKVVTSLQKLDELSHSLGRSAGLGGVLVPTMGALHEAHAALIRRARGLAGERPCVVSIFVNPTQFNDPADFSRYPRTLDADLATCRGAGATVVFAPGVPDVYPLGSPAPAPRLPDVATRPRLEDLHRPGHFAGVCQVVRRLFDLLRPDAAVFGEKDWQQLRVIAALAEQERLPINIIPHPTLREPDGLAMSSRNVFLSRGERERALSISRALREAGTFADVRAAEDTMRRLVTQAGLEVEYAVVRDARTLLEPRGECRALIAARAGSVRLIDNLPWPGS